MSNPYNILEPTVISFSGKPTYQQMIDFSKSQIDMFDKNEEAIACFCGD